MPGSTTSSKSRLPGRVLMLPADVVFVPKSGIANVNRALRLFVYNNLLPNISLGFIIGP